MRKAILAAFLTMAGCAPPPPEPAPPPPTPVMVPAPAPVIEPPPSTYRHAAYGWHHRHHYRHHASHKVYKHHYAPPVPIQVPPHQ